MEKKVITLEELKDFDIWKSWKNGELELSTETPFQTKIGRAHV